MTQIYKRAVRKSRAEVRSALIALHQRAEITPAEERAAADRYWKMLGHDLPVEERGKRARVLSKDAPRVGVSRVFRKA